MHRFELSELWHCLRRAACLIVALQLACAPTFGQTVPIPTNNGQPTGAPAGPNDPIFLQQIMGFFGAKADVAHGALVSPTITGGTSSGQTLSNPATNGGTFTAGDISGQHVTPTGATTPSGINDWMMRRCPSPEDYRTFAGGGTATDTQAIQAAINAAENTGAGCVWVPARTYTLGPITIAGNNLTILCANAGSAGAGGSKFLAADLTSTMFNVGIVSGVFFRACSWLSASQQAAGSYVDFEGGNSSGIVDGYMAGGFDPLVMNNTNVMHTDHLRFFDWAHNMVTIGGGNPGPGAGANGGGGDQYFYDIIGDNDATVSPNAGWYVTQSGGSITNASSVVIHAHNTLWVNPGPGQFVSWIYAVNTYLDSCDYPSNLRGGVGLKVTPHGGGIANGGSFTNLWSSTCSSAIQLMGDGAPGTLLDDYQISNLRALHSYGDGVDIANASNIYLTTPTISGGSVSSPGTSSGLVLGAGADKIGVYGGRIGPSETYPASFKLALVIQAGFAGRLTMLGTDLTGNVVGSVSDNGTATAPVRIESSPGYNPLGPAIVSLGASPATYIAGRTKEMVSIVGGAVSSVLISGPNGNVTVCVATPCTTMLSPQQIVTVTYSSPPTFVTNRD